jgi:RimJ/RimL family protein N-acetyltransferase
MAANLPDNRSEEYRKVVIIRDGSNVQFRPIVREDEEKMLDLFYRLSPHTVYLRFHGVLTQMSRDRVAHFCTVDYDDTFALVATAGEGVEEKIIAVGRYYRLPKTDAAELALVVEDAYQGEGIGTHLLEQLASIAMEKGIRFFEADVLAENQQMMDVLKNICFQTNVELEQGVYRVSLNLTPTCVPQAKLTE